MDDLNDTDYKDDINSIRCKKGLTLLEIIITLGLTGIVISLIMAIFIVNYKNYKIINDQRELQFQAQHIFTFMANKIKASMHIEQIRYDLKSKLSDTNEQGITKVCFRYDDEISECYIFEAKNKKMFYDNELPSRTANVLLGEYVDHMFASPVPEGTSFRDAHAIKIRLKLTKGNQSYEVEQVIYMRNRSNVSKIKYNSAKVNKYIDKCLISL